MCTEKPLLTVCILCSVIGTTTLSSTDCFKTWSLREVSWPVCTFHFNDNHLCGWREWAVSSRLCGSGDWRVLSEGSLTCSNQTGSAQKAGWVWPRAVNGWKQLIGAGTQPEYCVIRLSCWREELEVFLLIQEALQDVSFLFSKALSEESRQQTLYIADVIDIAFFFKSFFFFV